jgi:hypothetical protein
LFFIFEIQSVPTLPEYLDNLKRLPPSDNILEIVGLLENYGKEGADKSAISGQLRQKIGSALTSSGLPIDTRKAIFEMALALTEEAPLNEEDLASNEVIPAAYRIYLSSGYQLDIRILVSFHNIRQPIIVENEDFNKKWLRNTGYIEQKLNAFDVAHAKKFAANNNLVLENLFIEEVIQLVPNPALEGQLEEEYHLSGRPEFLHDHYLPRFENNVDPAFEIDEEKYDGHQLPQPPANGFFSSMASAAYKFISGFRQNALPPARFDEEAKEERVDNIFFENPVQAPISSNLKNGVIAAISFLPAIPMAALAASEISELTQSKAVCASVATLSIGLTIYTNYQAISKLSKQIERRYNNRANNHLREEIQANFYMLQLNDIPLQPAEPALPNIRSSLRNLIFGNNPPANINEQRVEYQLPILAFRQ